MYRGMSGLGTKGMAIFRWAAEKLKEAGIAFLKAVGGVLVSLRDLFKWLWNVLKDPKATLDKLKTEMSKLIASIHKQSPRCSKEKDDKKTEDTCPAEPNGEDKGLDKDDTGMKYCAKDKPYGADKGKPCFCRPSPKDGSASFMHWPLAGIPPTKGFKMYVTEKKVMHEETKTVCEGMQNKEKCVKLYADDVKALKAAVEDEKTCILPKKPDEDYGIGSPKYIEALKLMKELKEELKERTIEAEGKNSCLDPAVMAKLEPAMEIFHKRVAYVATNENTDTKAQKMCKMGKTYQVFTKIWNMIKGGAQKVANLLPDLTVVGASVDAFATRVGAESVHDFGTYESSLFEFHGFASNSFAGMSACGYVGMGWKGNTQYASVEDAYKGWFVGLEPAAAPPPISLIASGGMGIYMSADERIPRTEKTSVAGKSANTLKSLAVTPVWGAIKSFGICMCASVGPSLSAAGFSVSYVQTFYNYIAGRCHPSRAYPKGDAWSKFMLHMVTDALIAPNGLNLVGLPFNFIYGIVHRLVKQHKRHYRSDLCSPNGDDTTSASKYMKALKTFFDPSSSPGGEPPNDMRPEYYGKADADVQDIKEGFDINSCPGKSGGTLMGSWKKFLDTVLMEAPKDKVGVSDPLMKKCENNADDPLGAALSDVNLDPECPSEEETPEDEEEEGSLLEITGRGLKGFFKKDKVEVRVPKKITKALIMFDKRMKDYAADAKKKIDAMTTNGVGMRSLCSQNADKYKPSLFCDDKGWRKDGVNDGSKGTVYTDKDWNNGFHKEMFDEFNPTGKYYAGSKKQPNTNVDFISKDDDKKGFLKMKSLETAFEAAKHYTTHMMTLSALYAESLDASKHGFDLEVSGEYVKEARAIIDDKDKYPCVQRNRLLKIAQHKCKEINGVEGTPEEVTTACDGFKKAEKGDDCKAEAALMPAPKIPAAPVDPDPEKECVSELTAAFPKCTDTAKITKQCEKSKSKKSNVQVPPKFMF